MLADLPITKKLTIAFGAIMTVTVMSAGFMLYQTEELASGLDATKTKSEILSSIEDYRIEIEGTHKAVLLLINSSNIDYLTTIEKRLEETDRARARLLAQTGAAPDASLGAAARAIDESVTQWRNNVVAEQLGDMRNPYTVDLARVREVSEENALLWEDIEHRFSTVMQSLINEETAALEHERVLLGRMRSVSIGGTVLLLVICMAMGFLMRNTVAAPLRSLAVVTGRLKDREWDVTVPCTARGDEVGALAKVLETFREEGREHEAAELAQREADAQALRKAEAVQRSVANFRHHAAELLNQLHGAADTLGSESDRLEHVAGATYDFTESVSGNAKAVGASVQNVAAAIEEMTMSIRDISGQLQNVSNLTERTRQASAAAGRQVAGLQARSEEIHSVVDLINGIAGQINLLALNATIESARAGEAGRGFAVVAHQVKQLADQTAKATEDIGRVISLVTNEVSEIVGAIGTIDTSIAEVNTNTGSVAAAVEEQSSAIDEISRNVATVSQETASVADSVHGAESKVGETRDVARSVSALSSNLDTTKNRLGSTIDAFIASVSDSGPRDAANDRTARKAA